MNKSEARKLTDEELKIVYNEYKRRWRKTHKDSVRLANWKYKKKVRDFKLSKLG